MSAAGNGPGEGGGGAPGLRFGSPSPLVERALDEVQKGPQSTEALARKVLGLRSAPGEMADRLLRQLLEGHRRLRVDAGGVWRLREPGGAEREALGELDYTVVDVETTGSSPSRGDRITEIAAVQVSGGAIVDEFSSLVNPGRPIPPWIEDLTGITQAMVSDAPPFGEVAGLVRERLEGRVFVAHNVPFDWRFVADEMRRAASVAPEGPRLCTLRLSRRALPELPRKGLDAVARYYGIEIDGRHRAAGDALATASLLLRLLEEADRRGVTRWNELNAWLSGSPPPAERDGTTAGGGGS